MGGSDAEAAAKAPKTSTAGQEQPPATSSTPAMPAYPDWSSFQAYSPIPPHGFFPSPVASSPPAPPFMWGPQVKKMRNGFWVDFHEDKLSNAIWIPDLDTYLDILSHSQQGEWGRVWGPRARGPPS